MRKDAPLVFCVIVICCRLVDDPFAPTGLRPMTTGVSGFAEELLTQVLRGKHFLLTLVGFLPLVGFEEVKLVEDGDDNGAGQAGWNTTDSDPNSTPCASDELITSRHLMASTCDPRKPVGTRPARMLVMVIALPVMAERPAASRRIWPPPSWVRPSMVIVGRSLVILSV